MYELSKHNLPKHPHNRTQRLAVFLIHDMTPIQKFLTALAAGVPYSVNFRATDNTTVAMDAATGAAFYQTMIGAAQAIWDAYNAADAALQAAATVAEVEGVTL